VHYFERGLPRHPRRAKRLYGLPGHGSTRAALATLALCVSTHKLSFGVRAPVRMKSHHFAVDGSAPSV
jgi:hypothetical protein